MLQRVRDLAVQFNNGTLSTSDKAAITLEVTQLCDRDQPDRVADEVQRHRAAHGQHGRSRSRSAPTTARPSSVTGRSLFGSGASFDVDSAIFNFSGGTVTLASIDAAIDNVSTARATFGSVQNRLEHTLNNLASYEENLQASESRIKDVDMASEMVRVHEVPDPAAGRHFDAGPGQLRPAVGSLAPQGLEPR